MKYENETVYLSGNGWAVRTYTEDGEDWSEMYELPSDKGWISDMVTGRWRRHLDQEEIDFILEHMRGRKPRGNHPEGTRHA